MRKEALCIVITALKEQNKTRMRLQYVDFIKGFGIVLMVLAHIPLSEKFVMYVHAFHMPLFFFVSGWLYVKKDIGFCQWLKNRSKKLLLPYLVFSMAGFMLWLITIRPDSANVAFEPLKAIFWHNTDGMPIVGSVWFLTAILFVDVSYCLLDKYCRDDRIKTLIIVTIGLWGFAGNKLLHCSLPFAIGSGCVGILFFHAAYMLRTRENRSIQWFFKGKSWMTAVVLVVLPFSVFYNGKVNLRTGVYNNIVLFLVNALSIIILIWKVSLWIYDESEQRKISRHVTRRIESIGRNSIVYVCLNEMVIYVLSSITNKISVMPLAMEVIKIVLVFLVMYFCEFVFTRTPLSCLMGIQWNKKRRDDSLISR